MEQEKRAFVGQIQSPVDSRDTSRPIERVRLADAPTLRADLQDTMYEALHSAAHALWRDGAEGQPDERARQALDAVCALAHRDEIRAEQLLILLKDTWRRLPEVQRAARMDADVTLACVVTHCIEEFYRTDTRS